MTRLETFGKELANEAITTTKMLERIPVDKLDWAPHSKSMKPGALASHITELPMWVEMALTTEGLDFAANPYEATEVKNTAQLLDLQKISLEKGLAALEQADESILDTSWVLRNGDEIYADTTKAETIRMAMSQVIHHRAQLGVYLRLLDVPIPGSYGPSADDQGF